MPIAQNTLIAAVGDTINSTTYATSTITPTPNRLLIFVVMITYSGADQDFTISGGPSVTWETFINATTLGSGRRCKVFAALSGASPGSGVITINALAAATGCVYYLTEFSGTFLGSSALDSFYGLNMGSNASTLAIQVAPSVPFASGGDATISILSKNSSPVATAERVIIAEAGYTTPVHRLGMQWYLGDDSDGPAWTWLTTVAVADVWTFYLRSAIEFSNALGTVGNSTDATVITVAASNTPPANALYIMALNIAATSPTLPILGGTLGLSWVLISDSQSGSYWHVIYAALTGSTPPTGTVTVQCTGGQTITCVTGLKSIFTGVYLGASPLDTFYGGAVSNYTSVLQIQRAPFGSYDAVGDATLSWMFDQRQQALTSYERTTMGENNQGLPACRTAGQWFLGDDSDGPLFTWATAGTGRCVTYYLRSSLYVPSTWVPQAVTVQV